MIRHVTNLLSLLPDMPALSGPLANSAAVLPAEGGAGLDFAGLLGAAAVAAPPATGASGLPAALPEGPLPEAPATLPFTALPLEIQPQAARALPTAVLVSAPLPDGRILPEPGAQLPPAPGLAVPLVAASDAAPHEELAPGLSLPDGEMGAEGVAEVPPAPAPISIASPQIPVPAGTAASDERPAPGAEPSHESATVPASFAAVPAPIARAIQASDDDGPSPASTGGDDADAEPGTNTAEVDTAALPVPAPVLLAAVATSAPVTVTVSHATSRMPRAETGSTPASIRTPSPQPVVMATGTTAETQGDDPAAASPTSRSAAAAGDTAPAAAPALTLAATASAVPAAAPDAAALPAAVSPQQAPAAAPVPERAATAPQPQAHQIESTIAQVGDIREALRSARPSMTLHHAEFGMVSLRLEQAAPEQWRAVLASRDPGFVPAVQAALADRAVSAAADTSANFTGQHGSAHQNGTADHRYGASPNGGQGSSQPYLGQSGSRDGEAAPDHRRPSTAAALAGRGGEERDEGSAASNARAQGGLFA